MNVKEIWLNITTIYIYIYIYIVRWYISMHNYSKILFHVNTCIYVKIEKLKIKEWQTSEHSASPLITFQITIVSDLFQPHLRKLANRYTKARDTTRARDRCSLVYCIWIPQMAYRSHGSILPIPCGSTYINGWPSELVSRCLSFRLLGLIN